MIIDKDGILDLLCNEDEFIKKANAKENAICIRTVSNMNHFDKNTQISNDSIDLSISNAGYILSDDYEYMNTLGKDLKYHYQKVKLPEEGYLLNPECMLFISTNERIALSGKLIGRVTGRSAFSRMGLSVHCTQDKFSSGINSVVGLQLKNNGPIPLRIFPNQLIAQMLIEETHANIPYRGNFDSEEEFTLPVIKDEDRERCRTKRSVELILEQEPSKKSYLKRKASSFSISIVRCIVTAAATILMGIFGILQDISALAAIGILCVIIDLALTWADYVIKKDNDSNE